MKREFDKEQIIKMLRPLSDCIHDDNHIRRKEILDKLMIVRDKLDSEVIK